MANQRDHLDHLLMCCRDVVSVSLVGFMAASAEMEGPETEITMFNYMQHLEQFLDGALRLRSPPGAQPVGQ